MDLPIHPSPPFDLNQATADAIAEQFPRLGLFCAEDVVAWRDKNGPITSADPLIQDLGVPVDLAHALVRDIARNATQIPADHEFVLIDALPRESRYLVSRAPERFITVSKAPDPIIRVSKAPGPVPASKAPSMLRSTPPASERAPLPESKPRSPLAALVAARIAEEEAKHSILEAEAQQSAMNSIFIPEPTAESTSPSTDVEGIHAAPASDGPVDHTPGRKRSRTPWLVAGIVVLNAGIAGFLAQVYTDGRRMHGPVAAMAADVTDLKDEQEKTRTDLDATRALLAKQAKELAAASQRIAAAEARQHEVAHALKEQTVQQMRNAQTANDRMRQIEVRADKQTYDVGEAMKLIDDVQGRLPTVSASQ